MKIMTALALFCLLGVSGTHWVWAEELTQEISVCVAGSFQSPLFIRAGTPINLTFEFLFTGRVSIEGTGFSQSVSSNRGTITGGPFQVPLQPGTYTLTEIDSGSVKSSNPLFGELTLETPEVTFSRTFSVLDPTIYTIIIDTTIRDLNVRVTGDFEGEKKSDGILGDSFTLEVVNPQPIEKDNEVKYSACFKATIASNTTIGVRPIVNRISPDRGPRTGGTDITLTGENFQDGATLMIGDAPATHVVLVSETALTAQTPAGKAGRADVVVRNPDGLEGRLMGGFTYLKTMLTFVSEPQNVPAGFASEPITMEAQDTSHHPVIVTQDVTINVTITPKTDSGTGVFSTTADFATTVSEITLPSGTSSVSFYYKGTTSGDATITARATGWEEAQHVISISPAIKTIRVEGSPAKSGETLAITAETVPDATGGSATFSIGSNLLHQPMTEMTSAYKGTYTVKNGDDITNAPVTVTLNGVHYEASEKVTIDTVLPDVRLILTGNKGENDWYRSAVVVAPESSDNGSGVKSEHIKIDNGSWQTPPVTIATEGIHTVESYVQDKAGNEISQESVKVKVDKTAPPSPVVMSPPAHPPNQWTNDNSPAFPWAPPSDTSGIEGYSLELSQNPETTPDETVDISDTFKSYQNLGDADNWYFHIRAKDQAGWWGDTSHFGPIKIDVTPPTTDISLSGDEGKNGWYKTPVHMTFSATDSSSGVASTQYRIDNGSWQKSSSKLTLDTEGEQTIESYSVDQAENREETKSKLVKIDTKPPTTTLTVSGKKGNDGWYISFIQVTLSVEDATSGVDVTHYQINEGGWQNDSQPITIDKDGQYIISYNSKDKAGNQEVAQQEVIKLDATPPETAFQISGTKGENDWYTSLVEITLSVEPDTLGVVMTKYRINEGDWQDYSKPIRLNKDGKFTLDYYSEDAAGNQEKAKSEQVTIDPNPPELSVWHEPDELTVDTKGDLTIKVKAIDRQSGIWGAPQLDYQIGDAPIVHVEMLEDDPESWSVEIQKDWKGPGGKKITYQIAVRDRAGNWGESEEQCVLIRQPVIVVSPQPIDFGSVPVNGPVEKRLTVSNEGNSDLNVTDIICDCAPNLDLSETTFTVPQGKSHEITLTLTASAPGPIDGTLTIVSNDPNSPTEVKISAVAVPPPTVTTLSPTSGPIMGGTPITITGTNFVAGATVTVGGFSATHLEVVPTTQIKAITPAGSAGPADVVVKNSDGQSGTLKGGFTYVDVTPSALGQGAQEVEVTITGAGFQQGTNVSFGDGITPIGRVTVENTTRLKVRLTVASQAPVGPRVVTVSQSDGTSVEAAVFSVTPKPVVTQITPSQGAQGSTLTDMSIVGNHFILAPVPSVSLGEGIEVITVRPVSQTELKVDLTIDPIAPIESRRVTIINGDFGVGSEDNRFRVEPAPLPARIRIDPAPSTIDEGDSVTFTADFTDSGDNRPHTFQWKFGDGETSDQQVVTHQYTQDGTYTVTLTVTDADNVSGVDMVEVSVKNVPPEVKVPVKDIIIVGNTVTFRASVTDPGTDAHTFLWDFGDGSLKQTVVGEATATHEYKRGGVYTVTLTGGDGTDESQAQLNVQVVFPGDTDNDGIVDAIDILPIGPYWEEDTKPRKNASVEWKMQRVDAPQSPEDDYWKNPSPAYADTNGDGVVNVNDIQAIVVNWGKGQPAAPQASPPQSIRFASLNARLADASRQTLEIYEQMLAFLERLPPSEATVTLKAFLSGRLQALRQQYFPEVSQLLPNYPNPFNPETWIPFRLAENSKVTLTIYDMTGKVVRTIDVGHQPAAVYESKDKAIYWDGRNDFGEGVASGVYLYTLTANDFTATRKLLLLK